MKDEEYPGISEVDIEYRDEASAAMPWKENGQTHSLAQCLPWNRDLASTSEPWSQTFSDKAYPSWRTSTIEGECQYARCDNW